MSDETLTLLQLHLEATVPLLIKELKQQGGPQDWQIERLHDHVNTEFLTYGEAVLYPMPHTKEAMDTLVKALAILSFYPGGVKAFGLEFHTEKVKIGMIQQDDTLFHDLEPLLASLEQLEQEEVVDPYSDNARAAIKIMKQEQIDEILHTEQNKTTGSKTC